MPGQAHIATRRPALWPRRVRHRTGTYPHPLVIRLTPWLHVIALTVVVLSGLRMFWVCPDDCQQGQCPCGHLSSPPACANTTER